MPAERKNTNRLAGHTLASEGAPYFKLGNAGASRVRSTKVGRGLCSCSEMSPVMETNNERKRWHRQHKDEIRPQKENT